MKFLEKTLEEMICSNLLKVGERGLTFLGSAQFISAKRQVQLGAYGIADIIAIEYGKLFNDTREITISIIECKLHTIDLNAYQQAKRYKAAVKEALTHFDLQRTHVEIKTVLIGSEFCTKGDFPFVYSDDPTCECYTYSYDFNGLQFKKIGKGWTKTDSKLPIQDFKDHFLRCYKQTYTEANKLVAADPF